MPHPVGSVIFVPMRSKEWAAVVVSSAPLHEKKIVVRSADFSLRKIRKQTARTLFSPALLEAATDTALDGATTPGEIFSAVTPSVAFEVEIGAARTVARNKNSASRHAKPRRVLAQGSEKERYETYRREIEKTLKKRRSVVVLVPTVEDGERLAESLKEHFPDAVLELSSRFSKKKQREIWIYGRARKQATIFVLTPGFLSLPMLKLGLCILEKSGSHHYFSRKRPLIDARVFFEHFSAAHGVPLISGDVLIPLREKTEAFPKSLDSLGALPKIDLVDMTRVEKQKETFVLLSKELIRETRTHLANDDVFWFVARRGLFPETVCRDCRAIHPCPVCGAQFVLHTKKRAEKEERIFLCHRCGARESASVVCRVCGSWRLEPLGIGIERVAEAAREMCSDVRVLSHDHTPTKASVRKELEKTGADSGRLIIGTDLALFHLRKTFPLVGIVSMDSRLGIPAYDAEEAALRTLFSVALLSHKSCILQTRQMNHRIFTYARGTRLNEFREEEALIRKQFSYPPFGTFIDLSFVSKKDRAEALAFEVPAFIKPALGEGEEIAVLPLRALKQRGSYRGTIVLKLRTELRNHSALRSRLLALPPSVEVRVNHRVL
jgi:primosomal protein N' (replication factor Y)